MTGVFSLLAALAVSLIVNRIATMALMFTGLSREAAKFQARSAFTGVGYTTREAENIVNHPVRRRIVMVLMLMGNIGIATVIATVVVSIGDPSKITWEFRVTKLAILTLGLFLLWMISSSRTIERQLNKLVAWALQTFTQLDARDYVELLQLSDGYAVTEMVVERNHWLTGGDLAQLRLSDEGILILGIHRLNGVYQGIPRATDTIGSGDTLILYGNVEDVRDLDRRRTGAAGDRAHQQSVQRKEQVPDDQALDDNPVRQRGSR